MAMYRCQMIRSKHVPDEHPKTGEFTDGFPTTNDLYTLVGTIIYRHFPLGTPCLEGPRGVLVGLDCESQGELTKVASKMTKRFEPLEFPA